MAQLDPERRDPTAPLQPGSRAGGKRGEDVPGRSCLSFSNQKMKCKHNVMVISVILTFVQLTGKPRRCMV